MELSVVGHGLCLVPREGGSRREISWIHLERRFLGLLEHSQGKNRRGIRYESFPREGFVDLRHSLPGS